MTLTVAFIIQGRPLDFWIRLRINAIQQSLKLAVRQSITTPEQTSRH